MIVNTPEDDKKAKPASKKTNTVTELLGMEVVLAEMAKMAEQNSEAIADRIKDFLKMRKIGKKSKVCGCLLYTSPSPRDRQKSRMPSSA